LSGFPAAFFLLIAFFAQYSLNISYYDSLGGKCQQAGEKVLPKSCQKSL
jgi:hypothetical protein